MCKLEDYGSHNTEYVWGLEMSASWTAELTRSQRTTQTRVYNLQPVAHYGVIFLHQWAVLPPVFACHMADLSFTWKLCSNNSVYKYMGVFFVLGTALPILFSTDLTGAYSHLFLYFAVSQDPVLHTAVRSTWLLSWGCFAVSGIRLLSDPCWGFSLHAPGLRRRWGRLLTCWWWQGMSLQLRERIRLSWFHSCCSHWCQQDLLNSITCFGLHHMLQANWSKACDFPPVRNWFSPHAPALHSTAIVVCTSTCLYIPCCLG